MWSDTFEVPFFEPFVSSRSRFSDFLFPQGPIFKFLSTLGLNSFHFSALGPLKWDIMSAGEC